MLRAGFERLTPASRYRRFLTPLDHLSDQQLEYLTDVDHHDHEAIAALTPAGEGIGVARYVRWPEAPDSAEVAVAVVDDWQGRGLGSALLEELTDRAGEEGIELEFDVAGRRPSDGLAGALRAAPLGSLRRHGLRRLERPARSLRRRLT